MKDIARILDIAPSTVSRALQNHQSIGLTMREKVRKTADELEYQPNQAVVYFRKGRTFTIGVIIPKLSECFFAMAVSSIEHSAAERGFLLIIGQSHDDQDTEILLVEKMKNFRVDGLLVSVVKNPGTFEHYHQIKSIIFL